MYGRGVPMVLRALSTHSAPAAVRVQNLCSTAARLPLHKSFHATVPSRQGRTPWRGNRWRCALSSVPKLFSPDISRAGSL